MRNFISFQHCEELTWFQHCEEHNVFQHCEELLEYLAEVPHNAGFLDCIIQHCEELYFFQHCEEHIIFLHCEEPIVFQHCEELLEYLAHVPHNVAFSDCNIQHCEEFYKIQHCEELKFLKKNLRLEFPSDWGFSLITRKL